MVRLHGGPEFLFQQQLPFQDGGQQRLGSLGLAQRRFDTLDDVLQIGDVVVPDRKWHLGCLFFACRDPLLQRRRPEGAEETESIAAELIEFVESEGALLREPVERCRGCGGVRNVRFAAQRHFEPFDQLLLLLHMLFERSEPGGIDRRHR